ncbi:IS3 family transposase [Marinithermofilum abyssi]
MFWTLKSEFLNLHSFNTDEEVRQAVFYNNQRFQSRLNHLSPVDYRAETA